jgi:ELWxxDGT repeat protein
LNAINGQVYFAANHPGLGNELWTSDGTAPGTIPVKDLFAGSTGSGSTNFVVFRNHLYFTATSDVYGLSIWRVNFKPTAASDAYAATEDTLLIVPMPGVTANDSDADGDALSVQLVSGAAHGVVNLNSDGSFTYLAASNYSGPDSFSYRVSDGAAFSSSVVVNLNVIAVADPPSVSVANANGFEGSPIPLSINAALVDNDGSESLAINISGVPTGVTFVRGNQYREWNVDVDAKPARRFDTAGAG